MITHNWVYFDIYGGLNLVHVSFNVSLERKWAQTEKEKKTSDPGEIQTHDLRYRSPLIYQLSYKARWEPVMGNRDGN